MTNPAGIIRLWRIMMYKKTEAKVNFADLEKEVLNASLWATTYPKKSFAREFVFFDGPATPSSIPHIGHLGVSSIKDAVVRYNVANGANVHHQLGWDVHGLPTELMVEKEYGKPAKQLVEENGIKWFCDKCRYHVMKYVDEWDRYLKRLGRIVDTKNVYNTMDKDYMESVMWAVKTLFDKNLLYPDHRICPLDPKLGTVLSNSELEYRETEDTAAYVVFELANKDRNKIMVWTTTPWTLYDNQYLAINPNMQYVLTTLPEVGDVIVARDRLHSILPDHGDYVARDIPVIKNIINGEDLVGINYHPLFNRTTESPNYHKILAADFVSTDSGTGVVHIAPAFGEDDYNLFRNTKFIGNSDPSYSGDSAYMSVFNSVDEYGNYTEGPFEGKNVLDPFTTTHILAVLETDGNLWRTEKYKHEYPFSPRSNSKVIYRAMDCWYVDVPKIKDQLLANNEKVNWLSAGNRFKDWIENARAWAVSRNRFWGTPLPIWKDYHNHYKVFGSVAEMEDFFGVKIDDLHRPTLDKLEKDGFKRIPDVLDAWFESGSMPFASKHYPFDTKEVPVADYIVEGQDQTRGWFYTLMVLSTALFDQPAFKTVSANGMVLDTKRMKMSKSLGNYFDPMKAIETYGADAVRLTILNSRFMNAEPVALGPDSFNDVVKTILSPLWNAYHFFTLYANTANIDLRKDGRLLANENILDRYILSKLGHLEKTYDMVMSGYDFELMIKSIVDFLDVLNNWYIRLNRKRFWDEDIVAFSYLEHVLLRLCHVLNPFAPFLTEYIYYNIGDTGSLYTAPFRPHCQELSETDTAELKNMNITRDIVSLGKRARERAGIQTKQPLQSLTVYGDVNFSKEYADLVCQELNVKEVLFNKDIFDVKRDTILYPIVPTLMPRLKKDYGDTEAGRLLQAIKKGNWSAEKGFVSVAGYCRLNDDEYDFRYEWEDEVTPSTDNTYCVGLDTTISEELLEEGVLNEILRQVQDERKKCGFDVSDRITIKFLTSNPKTTELIHKYADFIKEQCLATSVDVYKSQLDHLGVVCERSLLIQTKDI